jgi:hypothetical protein
VSRGEDRARAKILPPPPQCGSCQTLMAFVMKILDPRGSARMCWFECQACAKTAIIPER